MRQALLSRLLKHCVVSDVACGKLSSATTLPGKNVFDHIRYMSACPSEMDPYTRLEDRIAAPYTVSPQPVFAVVEVSGTQYKVTPDDLIVTEKLKGVDINDKVRLNKVLLVGSKTETTIGRPYIPDASVTAAVEEQFLDGKVIVFKKRRRKNSRRTNGHRQPLTSLRILSVDVPNIEQQ